MKTMLRKVLPLVVLLAISLGVSAQTKKDAVDAYNNGATLMKNDPKAALESLYKAIEISEQLGEEGMETKSLAEKIIPTVHYSYAMTLYKAKDQNGTLEQLEKAEETAVKYGDASTQSKVEKTIPKFYYAVGVTNYKEKAFEKAIEYYKKALKITPNFPDALLGIALSYEGLNNFDEMLNYLQQTLDVANKTNNKDKADDAKRKANAYLLTNAQAMEKENKFAEANELYKKYLTFDEKDANIYYVLSVNYNKLEQYDSAIEAANKAIEYNTGTDSDKAGYYYQLATAFEKKGDSAAACDAYKKAAYGQFQAAAEYQIKEVLKCQ